MSARTTSDKKAEDELDAPRALALRNRDALTTLAAALVERSYDHYRSWGSVLPGLPPGIVRTTQTPGMPQESGPL